jgi:hypothetical protein
MSALAVVRPRPAPVVRAADPAPVASMPSGRRRLVLLLALVAVVAGALFAAVALNAAAAQSAVEARRLETQVRDAERAHARLVVAVATLEDPARVRTRALELGLVPAPAARHLVLDRAIAADGAQDRAMGVGDPLKPLLTQDR